MGNHLRLRAICVLMCMCAALAGGCATARIGSAPRPARINHIVLFKLNDSADATALIADCDERLADIPGVESYFAGPPIDTGRDDRVDGDYDVGLYVGFETVADYMVYVDHPDHHAVVERWGPKLQWLRAYDIQDDSQ